MSEMLGHQPEYLGNFVGYELSVFQREQIDTIPNVAFQIINVIGDKLRRVSREQTSTSVMRIIREMKTDLLEKAKSDKEKKIVEVIFDIYSVETRADLRKRRLTKKERTGFAKKDAGWQEEVIEVLSETESLDDSKEFWKIYDLFFEKISRQYNYKNKQSSINLKWGIIGPLSTAKLFKNSFEESEEFKDARFYLSTPDTDVDKKIDAFIISENYIFPIQIKNILVEQLGEKEKEDIIEIYTDFKSKKGDEERQGIEEFKESCRDIQVLINQNRGNKEVIGCYVKLPRKIYTGKIDKRGDKESKYLMDSLGNPEKELEEAFNEQFNLKFKNYGIIENTTA